MKITQRATGGTCIQAAGDITLGGSVPGEIIPVEVERVTVRPGDIVVVRPRDTSLTPNQAREMQKYLATYLPGITWLVLSLPADVTILTEEDA